MTTGKYINPNLCIGTFRLQNDCTNNADNQTMENYVAESIEIAGATINVFPLRGVQGQGQLIDLIGTGSPLCSGSLPGFDIANAYNISNDSWKSSYGGDQVVSKPAYIGYDFGIKKTSNGQSKYNIPARNIQHITSLRIQQGLGKAAQIRVDRSDGTINSNVIFSGSGNGQLQKLRLGRFPNQVQYIIRAISSTEFKCYSSISGLIKTISLGQLFATDDIEFTINQGDIPFNIDDNFTINLELNWIPVDVVNLPNSTNLETVTIKQSVPSPMWRIVPLMFTGTDNWEIVKLEMLDYQSNRLDTIQDLLYLENRDRDYSNVSVPLKCSYQPMDIIGDLGKFGFSIMDMYAFTCSFARMVELLGRPIVIGDIIEVVPEMQYDANLLPVKKYLEVSDCGWATDGFTPGWKPLLYRFQASQVNPSQENRQIFGTPNQPSYTIDDGSFFDNINQQTTPPLISETIKAEAQDSVPRTGSDGARTIASGTPLIPEETHYDIRKPEVAMTMGRGEYDGRDLYIEDGLPPNNEPYTEGYQLPDLTKAKDGEYFRLNYPIESNIPSRLFRFSAIKFKWIYIETDCRQTYSSHKPSVRNALISLTKKPLDKL
jgi:hypothetical protein